MMGLASGCASWTNYNSYSGLKPSYPPARQLQYYDPVVVDSLRPEFRWEESPDGQPQDFVIWDAGDNPRVEHVVMKTVYMKTGLLGPRHLIETNLLPDHVYFWSVRPVGAASWSAPSHKTITGSAELVPSWMHYYSFRTPKE